MKREKQRRVDVRTATERALAEGISKSPSCGEPVVRAVSWGAMSIADALRRAGVTSADLEPVVRLWHEARFTRAGFLTNVRALIGARGEKINYPVGSPMADLVSALFGRLRGTSDLIAAYRVVCSVRAKMMLAEVAPAPRPPLRRGIR
jgi:hypothetical protein